MSETLTVEIIYKARHHLNMVDFASRCCWVQHKLYAFLIEHNFIYLTILSSGEHVFRNYRQKRDFVLSKQIMGIKYMVELYPILDELALLLDNPESNFSDFLLPQGT